MKDHILILGYTVNLRPSWLHENLSHKQEEGLKEESSCQGSVQAGACFLEPSGKSKGCEVALG